MITGVYPDYGVRCDRCPAVAPEAATTPGRARGAAQRMGWAVTPNPEPGQREPLDLCPNDQPKET